jgi:hypothetical protein
MESRTPNFSGGLIFSLSLMLFSACSTTKLARFLPAQKFGWVEGRGRILIDGKSLRLRGLMELKADSRVQMQESPGKDPPWWHGVIYATGTHFFAQGPSEFSIHCTDTNTEIVFSGPQFDARHPGRFDSIVFNVFIVTNLVGEIHMDSQWIQAFPGSLATVLGPTNTILGRTRYDRGELLDLKSLEVREFEVVY